jgi:ribose-phosphate pyrophosphokinase
MEDLRALSNRPTPSGRERAAGGLATLRVVTGTANPALAQAVVDCLETGLAPCEVVRFPDGELRPVVDSVRGDDVYVLQPTGPPVNDHLVELLLLLDACRRAGAARLTAVVPYFGYARQDRRDRPGAAVAAHVAAQAIASAGADRVVVVDPHTTALEAMSAAPVEMLTAAGVLGSALSAVVPADAVLVAPDLGAVKLAERYARLLGLPVAIVRKRRLTGIDVEADELVGDVTDLTPVVVDDMISTGGTVEAAVRVLVEHCATPDAIVAASHGPLVDSAVVRLNGLPLRRLFVTDSVARHRGLPLISAEVCSIAPLLADAIVRLHHGQHLDDLLACG